VDEASQQLYDRVVYPGHFLRKVDAEVDLTFINGICDKVYRNGTSRGGRPAEEPERLFRALLVMVLYGLPSESSLVREIGVNLAYRWFCRMGIGEEVFDHSLLYVLRQRLEAELFETILVRIFMQCLEKGLVSQEWAFYDMTDIEACATPFTVYEKAVILARAVWRMLEQPPGKDTPADPGQPDKQAAANLRTQVIEVAKEVAHATHSRTHNIDRALQRLEVVSQTNASKGLPLTERVARNLQEQQSKRPPSEAPALKTYMEDLLEQMPEARGDPDARWGSTKRGQYFCGYLSGLMINGKRRVIAGTQLVAGNMAQVEALLSSHLPTDYRERSGQAPQQAALDAGFGYPEVALSLQSDWPETQVFLQPHPPPCGPAAQQQVYDLHHFELTEDNQLLCPNTDLPLAQRQMEIFSHRQDGGLDFRGRACQDCPLRLNCTTKASGPRVVKLHPDQYRARLRMEAQAQTDEHHRAMRQRMAAIEPVFGHGKTYHHWGKALYRSLPMNKIFNLLVAIALDVEKLVRYAPLERARLAPSS
jgi:transposase